MFRQLALAVTLAGAVIAMAPPALADPLYPSPGPMYPDLSGRYPSDVPGMNYEAALGAPCDNTEVFTFGRGRGGEVLACHYIAKQNSGYWGSSYPLQGQQDIGAPCPGTKSASQSPDGRPLVCFPGQGWQPGTLSSLPGPLYIPR